MLSMMYLLLTLLTVLPSVLSAPMCGLVPPKQASRSVSNPTSFNAADDVLATAWYPGWLADVYPPDKISWSKFNAMTFAFACVMLSLGQELLIDGIPTV